MITNSIGWSRCRLRHACHPLRLRARAPPDRLRRRLRRHDGLGIHRAATQAGDRWPNNLGVVVVDTLLVRLLLPVPAVGLAVLAADDRFGLFNVIALPSWLAVAAVVRVLHPAVQLH